ncbi:patatin-like phospholipase family protein [Propioniciclava soli]|uniref:patatin-like phospholipase family protein n=1 Tax=Propioniciclava soli TaxID=2775081 RepID=UPI001E6213C2|nr:patatin-like phospholipase family protein [Propioniciclava soli]
MDPDSPAAPDRECDVIMQGGVTSGVVYPRALARFAQTYRLRCLGGSSAGGIAAALAAAAEHGRACGAPGSGFAGLAALPDTLAGGRLADLFQPQPATRPLLPVLLALSGHGRDGRRTSGLARWGSASLALLAGWPLHAVLGAVPGLLGWWLALAATTGWATVGTAALASVVLVAGVVVVVGVGAAATLGRAVPANLFGVCTGRSEAAHDGPGFTDWFAERLDALAGRTGRGPLLHGHLWTGSDEAAFRPPGQREVDLRTVSTCLSQGRPYEMPWESRAFFYEPAAWQRLFGPDVMAALDAAPPARPAAADRHDAWAFEDAAAAARPRPLRRLPDPAHLPVVVSVRLSVSFPLLVSAVPLWTVDRRSAVTTEAVAAFRRGAVGPAPEFCELWFTDGGFTSNFPVHLFDEALPTRPTFAVHLGTFLPGREPDADESANIEYATDNRPLLPSHRPIPAAGWAGLTAFFAAAFATSREWPDASQLGTPGLRDRIVRVLQTPAEGGLNLHMPDAAIASLAARGEAAADGLVVMFTEPHYAGGTTGWDNHRWVRYRALLGTLPRWLTSWGAGRAAMADLDPGDPPSYRLARSGRRLAAELDEVLGAGADAVGAPEHAEGVADLTAAPRPLTVLRRMPQL